VLIDTTSTSNVPLIQSRDSCQNQKNKASNIEKSMSFVAKNGFTFSSEQTSIVEDHPSFKPKLKDQVAHLNSIEDFFNFLFNESMLQKLTEYTNKRLISLKNEKIAHLSPVEIKGFIGLLPP
jgi:hypothetical protein